VDSRAAIFKTVLTDALFFGTTIGFSFFSLNKAATANSRFPQNLFFLLWKN
jgi:hypothetical protein